MQRPLAQIDESIARYLSQLDSVDRQGEAVPEAKITRLNEKIAALRPEIKRPAAICCGGCRADDARRASAPQAGARRPLFLSAPLVGLVRHAIGLADPPHLKPSGPHQIKFNLMVPADCEPTSVPRASRDQPSP
jgi:hypothetical protein